MNTSAFTRGDFSGGADIRMLSRSESILTIIAELFRNPKKRGQLPFPDMVGDFKFVKKIMEGRHHNRFEFALYEKDRKVYFAKQLPLDEYCLESYWIRKEVNTLNILNSAISGSEELQHTGIRIPEVVCSYEDGIRLIVLYEYIYSARTLEETAVSDSKKMEIFSEALIFLDKAGRLMSEEQKSTMPKRTLLYFGLLFWPMLIKAFVRHPRRVAEILKLALKFTETAFSAFGNRDMMLVHRDLNPSNILLDGDGTVYVIDFEVAALSNPLYTEVGMATAAARRSAGLLKMLHKDLIEPKISGSVRNKSAYTYLCVYACIHSLATVPEWRIDKNFTFMKYCLGL